MKDFVHPNCPRQAALDEPDMPKTRNMASRKSQAEPVRNRAISIARKLAAATGEALQRGPTRLALIGGVCALGLVIMGVICVHCMHLLVINSQADMYALFDNVRNVEYNTWRQALSTM